MHDDGGSPAKVDVEYTADERSREGKGMREKDRKEEEREKGSSNINQISLASGELTIVVLSDASRQSQREQ